MCWQRIGKVIKFRSCFFLLFFFPISKHRQFFSFSFSVSHRWEDKRYASLKIWNQILFRGFQQFCVLGKLRPKEISGGQINVTDGTAFKAFFEYFKSKVFCRKGLFFSSPPIFWETLLSENPFRNLNIWEKYASFWVSFDFRYFFFLCHALL